MITTIITIASVIGALMVIGGFLLVIHKILNRFEKLENDGIKRKGENVLIIKSLFAICDGLRQQKCNGVVTKTWEELQDYIIKN